jgi:hypothetical protein
LYRYVEDEWAAQFPPDDVYAKEFSLNKNYPSEARVGAGDAGYCVLSPERDLIRKGGKTA